MFNFCYMLLREKEVRLIKFEVIIWIYIVIMLSGYEEF